MCGGVGGWAESHIDTINVKVFRNYVRIFFPFGIEILSAKINLTFHKALIERLIIYVRLALEISVDSCFLRPNRLQRSFSARLAILQGTQHFFAIGMLLSKFCTSMISLQSYASNKQKLHEMASVIRHGVAQPRKYEVTLPTVQVSVVLVRCNYNKEYSVFTSPGISEVYGVFQPLYVYVYRKHVVLSQDQNAETNHNIKIDSSSTERMEQFIYFGTTLTNQNLFRKKLRAD